MKLKSTNQPAGFTLLEVLVAVAIMGMVMVLVTGSSRQMLGAKDRVEKRDELFQAGRVALRKISSDLSVAFLTKANSAEGSSSDNQWKIFFIAQDKGDQDGVRFTSLNHLRLREGAKESDETRIAYEVGVSLDETRQLSVIRREDPWLDTKTELEGKGYPLIENIKTFELEYYDDRKDEWTKDWNTEQIDWKEKLPYAVRITISLADPDSEDDDDVIVLSTIVKLALSKGVITF